MSSGPVTNSESPPTGSWSELIGQNVSPQLRLRYKSATPTAHLLREEYQRIGPLSVPSDTEVRCVGSRGQPFELTCNSVRTTTIESKAPGKTSLLQRSFGMTAHVRRSSTTRYWPLSTFGWPGRLANLCRMKVSNIWDHFNEQYNSSDASTRTSQSQKCSDGSRCTLSKASVIVMADSKTGVGIAAMSRCRARRML